MLMDNENLDVYDDNILRVRPYAIWYCRMNEVV